jgi:hypothetical protein
VTATRISVALALAVHLLFLVSLGTGLLSPLFNDATHRGEAGSDFYLMYKAGRNVLRGDSPYRIDADEPPRSWTSYRYLPISALTLSVALALTPARTSYWLWVLFNECLLAGAVFATVKLARTRRDGLAGASLWLAFSPYYVEMFIGQFDFFVAVGVFGAALGLLGRRPLLGEGAWFVATVAKWNGVIVTPLMLSRGRWKVPALWGALALLTGGIYFALHPEDWGRFASLILRGGFATPHAGNYGVQALLSSLLPFVSPTLFTDLSRWETHRMLVTIWASFERVLLLGAGALALAATFLRRRRMTVGEGVALWIGALAVGYIEFWEHTYVLFLPALVLLFLEGRRRLALWVWWPLALPTFFALFDRPHDVLVRAMPAGYDNPDLLVVLTPLQNLLLHTPKAVPAAVLFGIVLLSVWRRTSNIEEPLALPARPGGHPAGRAVKRVHS